MKITVTFEYRSRNKKYKYYARTVHEGQIYEQQGTNFEEAKEKLVAQMKETTVPAQMTIEI